MNEELIKIAEALCLHAHNSHKEFKFDVAEISLRRALKLYPTKSTLWSNLGVVCFNKNKYDEAEVALKKAIEYFNEDEPCAPYTNLAILLSNQKRDDEARKLFFTAMEKEAKRVQPKWELAHLE